MSWHFTPFVPLGPFCTTWSKSGLQGIFSEKNIEYLQCQKHFYISKMTENPRTTLSCRYSVMAGSQPLPLLNQLGLMDWWIDGLMDWWIDGLMDWWIDGLIERWVDRWMDGWMEGWVDGGVGGWMYCSSTFVWFWYTLYWIDWIWAINSSSQTIFGCIGSKTTKNTPVVPQDWCLVHTTHLSDHHHPSLPHVLPLDLANKLGPLRLCHVYNKSPSGGDIINPSGCPGICHDNEVEP